MRWFLGPTNFAADVRTEIDGQIAPRERVPSSAGVPLTEEKRQVLILAFEQSDRLGPRYVEPEHMPGGKLRVEGSLAARLLRERGLKPAPFREELRRTLSPIYQKEAAPNALLALSSFLTGLKSLQSRELISFFTLNSAFIDATGKRWNREEIWNQFETLFAPYAKKNSSYVVETPLADTSELFVANVS